MFGTLGAMDRPKRTEAELSDEARQKLEDVYRVLLLSMRGRCCF